MDLELHPLNTARTVTFGNRVMDVLMFPSQGSQGELESHPGSGVGSVSTLSHLANHLIFFSGSWGGGEDSLASLSLSPHCCGDSLEDSTWHLLYLGGLHGGM